VKKADKTELSSSSLLEDANLFNEFFGWSHFKAKN
jgi:hypothetical protein